jgi:hypothetical protein
MVLSAFAVATVGVTASIHAQSGTNRDQATKLALATAEAGVTQALLDYNGGFTLTDTYPCLVPVTNPAGTVEPRTTASSGTSAWCAPVTGTNSGGIFSYQVCPATALHACAGSGTIEIVSTGTNGGVTRRVDVTAKSASGQQIFIDAGIKSQTSINLDSNAEIHSSSQAGGSIALSSTSTKLCGPSTVGLSGSATGAGLYTLDTACAGAPQSLSSVGHQALTLPPVNQGNAASVNDNCRITAAVTGVQSCAGTDYRDLISGGVSNVSWNPTTRTLAMTGQKTALTLTGKTYSFCKLTMSQNSTIYVAAGVSVNIFFDSPENCGLAPYDASSGTTQKNTAQLYMEANTRLTATTGQALGVYFVGSTAIPTGILMSSNSDGNAACVQNFVLYAPLSQIEMNSNSTYCGAIAGQAIHMDSNARFVTDNASQQIVLPGTPPHYAVSRFLDCATTSTPATPNGNC